MSYVLKDINKYSSIWSPHIRSYCLPNLIKKTWQCLWKGIDLASTQSLCGVLYLSSASSEKLNVKLRIMTAKLPSAYFMVNNRVLKMQNRRTRQAHIGVLPTIISWPQTICSSGSSRSRDVALLYALSGIFPHAFPVMTWIRSSV